ncbi:MAG TPA: alpha/beta hydrolase-fold protein [Clostridia bacterium]|nr:alpha/beta hydrolase-fold protein [Clostridia bacterium]
MKSIKKLLTMILGIILINGFFTSAYAASSVKTESHSSTVLNRTMNYNVYLPPSYSTDTTRKYPVMYLLHGMGGSYSNWKDMGMQSIVDKAGGKEMVIIMPDGLNNAFYVDGYQAGIKWDTYFEQELIPYVEAKYRIDPANGKNRAIAGLSMGGFGAAYHGFKYPDKFSSAYSMSGALEVTGNLFSVVNKNKYPAFTMECGTEDTLVGQMNVSFHNKLQQAGITHDYITRSGTHSVEFWNACLPKAIVFASKYFITGSSNKGDANKDGNVDSLDLAAIRKALLARSFSDIDTLAADMNDDKSIDAIDLALLKAKLLKIVID